MQKKPMRIRALFMLVCLLLSASQMFGWSAEGHQTVALIAVQLLNQSGQFTKVQNILGTLRLDDISTCPDELRAFQSSGTKMSTTCQQVFPTGSQPTGTSPWHFIDIPVTIANPTHADVVTACGTACVVSQIDAFIPVLADSTQPRLARLQALAFVTHFIGDIHQPLHSATRGTDAGGNAEQISLNGSTTSLHHAWDGPLVSLIDTLPANLTTDLAPEIAAAQAEAPLTTEGWALQSFTYAQTVVYPGIPNANGNKVVATLSATYQANAKTVIRQQIARGGVRLAQFLATNVAP